MKKKRRRRNTRAKVIKDQHKLPTARLNGRPSTEKPAFSSHFGYMCRFRPTLDNFGRFAQCFTLESTTVSRTVNSSIRYASLQHTSIRLSSIRHTSIRHSSIRHSSPHLNQGRNPSSHIIFLPHRLSMCLVCMLLDIGLPGALSLTYAFDPCFFIVSLLIAYYLVLSVLLHDVLLTKSSYC